MEKRKPIFTKRTLVDFLIGVGMGAGLDVAIPVDSDGTYANTLFEATLPLIWAQFGRKYDSLQERVTIGAAVYIGSVVGQTAYHLLKNL